MIMDKPIKAYTLNLEEGYSKRNLPVLSGVPQGSILLLASSTSVALFADDTKCYRSMKSIEDGACLQRDLDHISTNGVISGKWI